MTTMSAQRYNIPLTEPFRIAIGTVTTAHNVLVTSRDADHAGFGEGAPFPVVTGEGPDEVAARLATWLSEDDTRRNESALGLAAGLAVETARLDLDARRDALPLCTHLTGAAPRAVTTSITIPLMAPERAATVARAWRDAGFQAFKVKAGGDIEADVARIRRVREAVGAAEVRVDANQGWSREQARDVLPALVDLGVDVLEQPLHRDDLDGHADLRGLGVPIMLDEAVFGVEDARRALRAGACDRINIKLQKTGSIDVALGIASLAAEADVPCMLGCMIESRVGILAAAHVVAAHDNIRWADLDGHTFLATDPVEGGGVIEDGAIRLDDAPGLGVIGVQAGAVIGTRHTVRRAA